MSAEPDYLLKVPVRSDDRFERIHRDVPAKSAGLRRLVSQFSIRTLVEAI